MNLEIKIIGNIEDIKPQLKSISQCYHEDFLLEEIVFITIDDINKLSPLLKSIEIKEEESAYQI